MVSSGFPLKETDFLPKQKKQETLSSYFQWKYNIDLSLTYLEGMFLY